MKIKLAVEKPIQALKKEPVFILLAGLTAGMLSSVTLGILYPVMAAGLANVIIKISAGEKADFQDLFKFMNLLAPMFGLGLLIFIMSAAGLVFIIFPGLLIMALFVYAPYYMAFENQGIMASLKLSAKAAIANNLMGHVVIVLVLWLINLIGIQMLAGWILTFPLTVGFLYFLFEQTKKDGSSAAQQLSGSEEPVDGKVG
ncbi:MAG: hypothetical protein CVV21_00110 [Candidatus Goldiibacteriota bacterium HGW-Goldbacteria-1]|jgi:hypothetical protein|nr:MAG: hypothetical protein CVV21_00110 [Candidatus Goldiibacteriota bacterium HGW-Goldbacteria-1]